MKTRQEILVEIKRLKNIISNQKESIHRVYNDFEHGYLFGLEWALGKINGLKDGE